MASQELINAVIAEIASEASRRESALNAIPDALAFEERRPKRLDGTFMEYGGLSPLGQARDTVIRCDQRIQRLARALAHLCEAGTGPGELG